MFDSYNYEFPEIRLILDRLKEEIDKNELLRLEREREAEKQRLEQQRKKEHRTRILSQRIERRRARNALRGITENMGQNMLNELETRRKEEERKQRVAQEEEAEFYRNRVRDREMRNINVI